MAPQQILLQVVTKPPGFVAELWIDDSLVIAEVVYDRSLKQHMVRCWGEGGSGMCYVRLDHLVELLNRATDLLPPVT